jgi:hypothetical protein
MHRGCFLKSLAAAQAVGLVHVPLVMPWEAIAQQRGGMAPADPFKPSEDGADPQARRDTFGQLRVPGKAGAQSLRRLWIVF